MTLPPAARGLLLLAVTLFAFACNRNAKTGGDADDEPGSSARGAQLDGDDRGRVPATGKGARYALLVGVKSYDHSSLPSLRFTENDAEEMAEAPGKNGYRA